MTMRGSKSSKALFREFQRKWANRRTTEGPAPARSDLNKRATMRRYLQWLHPHLGSLGFLVFLAITNIGLDILWPLASAYLIDRVVMNHQLPESTKFTLIVQVSAGLLVVFAVNAAVNWTQSLRIQVLNSRLAFDLRRKLFRATLRMPLSKLHRMKTGGILSRLSTDVDGTSGLVQQAFLQPATAAVRLVLTLGVLFALNAQIALLVVLIVPPIVLWQASKVSYLRPIWWSIGSDRQQIDGRVGEGLSGMRVVRAFRREKLEEVLFTKGHHVAIRKQLLATHVQRSVIAVWDAIFSVAQLSVLALGGYLVVTGQTTIGVLVAFQALIMKITGPILQIANSVSGTQRGLAAADRVFEVLDGEQDVPDVPHALAAPKRIKELQFDHVDFAYHPGQLAIRDFSLTVKGGMVVALVGPSGAGKTTLTDLVARFLDPVAGHVRLNGMDLRQLNLRSYRSLLGVVSQDIFLFDGTVAENIAYGCRNADRAAIERAAHQANAHQFIRELPDGYDTLIGERGVALSGGQRQRLSIARALLADPQLLILDEATSNLDTENELLIRESMRELLGNRTTFIIAHRLSTVADADIVVVMDHGRAVQIGSHSELMGIDGPFRRMVTRQGIVASNDAIERETA